jgi:P pilus assembly chaperone PapD
MTKKYFFKQFAAKTSITFCLTIILSFISLTLFGQGNLLITPKRVVFEGNKRSEELNLANTGTDSASYVISFIQIKMTDDGKFEQITEPDSTLKIASNNLRFFPRSVTLAPNEAQSVKIQLIKSNSLEDGEYRSHLYFRGIPNNNKALGEESNKKEDGISVKITPIFGLTLPIIIRKGEPKLDMNISDISLQFSPEKEPYLKCKLNREGNISSYGDITVNYISNSDAVTRLALIKGLAVYTPNLSREINLKLDDNKSIDWHSGTLEVIYFDNGSSTKKLAEGRIKLN